MKTLTMYRPAAYQNVLSDFDKYLESFFGDSILAPVINGTASRIFNQMPAVDIQESDNSYVLDMELPGYDEKNIDIHVDGTNLTIASKQEDSCELTENEKKNGDNQGNYLLRERKYSSFTRSFKLPENADPEGVSASFKNGILTLNIKKRAEAQKKIIKINAA